MVFVPIPVVISPKLSTGEIPSEEEVFAGMKNSGWSDSPKDGAAVLLEDGREVLNPLPLAPPIGYVQAPTMMQIMEQMLRTKAILADEEVDTPEEADDFDIADEFDPRSVYEISMVEDFPQLPPEAPPPPPPPPPPPEQAV